MKREPKLRPSITWSDMSLACKAIDAFVTNAVRTNQVTRQVLEMSKVKEYLETFKPEEATKLSEQETLVKLMAKYGVKPASISDTVVSNSAESTNVLDQAPVIADAAISQLEPELTDDERYDVLKLSGEASYTDDDKLFMLNKGTMIMMKRAMGKPVNSEDL